MADVREVNACFLAPLPPRGKGRPRATTRAGHATVYTPTETRRWEDALTMIAQPHLGGAIIEAPVRVDILAVAPRPKRLMRRADPDGLIWRPAKPDGDNVRKAVLDALRAYWRDDAQVVSGETLSAYAERTGQPRVVVRVSTVVGDVEHAARCLGLVAVAWADAHVPGHAPESGGAR